MDEREPQRKILHRLAVLQHLDKVSRSVADDLLLLGDELADVLRVAVSVRLARPRGVG
jgi:hypothetical protein